MATSSSTTRSTGLKAATSVLRLEAKIDHVLSDLDRSKSIEEGGTMVDQLSFVSTVDTLRFMAEHRTSPAIC